MPDKITLFFSVLDGICWSKTRGACYSGGTRTILRDVQARSIPSSHRNVCVRASFYLWTTYVSAVLSLLLFFSLQSYDVDSAIAVIQDGSVSLKIDTQNLRDISFRTNSAYHFIGELLIRADNEVHSSPTFSSLDRPV